MVQCSIFRKTENNNKANADERMSLGKYHPHGHQNPKFDAFSGKIRNIKYGKQADDDIIYFTEQLHNIISDTENFVICVMPRHTIGTASSGIRTIAKRLCNPPIIDGTDVIYRSIEIPKKANGGIRDSSLEKMSLSVKNDYIIKDQQVLLLDDITTKGISLKAGKDILKNAGAELVAMYALGYSQLTW